MAKRVAQAKTLGLGESRLLQFWVSAEFRALLLLVSERNAESMSGYIRRALWQRLRDEAKPSELREYQAHAWAPKKTG